MRKNRVNKVWPKRLRIHEKTTNYMRHVQKQSEQNVAQGAPYLDARKMRPLSWIFFFYYTRALRETSGV